MQMYLNAAFPRETLGHGSANFWLRADVGSRFHADSHSVDASDRVVAWRRRGDRTRNGNELSALPPPSRSRRTQVRTALRIWARIRKRCRTKDHGNLQSPIACEIIRESAGACALSSRSSAGWALACPAILIGRWTAFSSNIRKRWWTRRFQSIPLAWRATVFSE
jgi:hypothetical protein